MSRRDQIQMTPEEVRAFLEQGRDLQVASINADGTPHLVTMWYVLDTDANDPPGTIAFWTYGKSQKVVNLRRDPRVTVLVATGDTYEELKGVSIAGTTEILSGIDAVLPFGEAVFARYWGPIENDLVREGVRAQAMKRVVVKVKPLHTTSWDHSKLGGTY